MASSQVLYHVTFSSSRFSSIIKKLSRSHIPLTLSLLFCLFSPSKYGDITQHKDTSLFSSTRSTRSTAVQCSVVHTTKPSLTAIPSSRSDWLIMACANLSLDTSSLELKLRNRESRMSSHFAVTAKVEVMIRKRVFIL